MLVITIAVTCILVVYMAIGSWPGWGRLRDPFESRGRQFPGTIHLLVWPL